MKAIVWATAAAILVQPLLYWGLNASVMVQAEVRSDQFWFLTGAVLVVAFAVVLIFGLPFFFLLRRYGKATALRLAIAGFLIAAIPIAAVGWPRTLSGYSSSAYWHGKLVDFYLNGEPTIYSWLNYVQEIFTFGLHGVAGALVFLFVWRRSTQPVP